MLLTKREFDTYEEASAFAAATAKKHGAAVAVGRGSSGWVVQVTTNPGEDQPNLCAPEVNLDPPKQVAPGEYDPTREFYGAIVVLKAHHLARRLHKHADKDRVLMMVDAAVEELRIRDQLNRALFYLLLKAEMCRGEDSGIEARGQAQGLSKAVDGGETHSYFMAVEEATQTRKKTRGLQGNIVEDKGLNEPASWWDMDGLRPKLRLNDPAAGA